MVHMIRQAYFVRMFKRIDIAVYDKPGHSQKINSLVSVVLSHHVVV